MKSPAISIAFGIVAALAVWRGLTPPGVPADGVLNSLAAALMGVAGTAVGFLLAALAIFATIVDRPLISRMIQAKLFHPMITELYWSAALFMASIMGGLVSFFVSADAMEISIEVCVGAFVAAGAMLCVAGNHLYITFSELR